MSAIATKKPYGDMGVQATFPQVFQQLFNAGMAYFPSDAGEPCDLMVGTNYQSEYHELKRLEANQNVTNRGINNRSADRKLLTGPHNYHVPKPVLGQRLYANPSLGDSSAHSTRRDNGRAAPFRTIEVGTEPMSGMMTGGVLKTREGYDFYKSQLDNRISQLNAMNALALGNAVPMGQTAQTSDNTKVGPPNKVEFFLLLNALEDAIVEGDLTRFTFENLKELLGKLFSMAPTASSEDFNDILGAVDIMLEDLEQGLSEIADNAQTNSFVRPDYASTLQLYMRGIKTYVDNMFRNINMSERDKTTLSKSLIKQIGFTQLLKKNSAREVVQAVRGRNPRVDQEAEDFDDNFDEGGDGDGHHHVPPEAREDEEQGGPRAPLAGENGDPNRDQFGAQRGAFGDARVFFADEGAPGMAQPLGFAGADAIAEVPQADPRAIRVAASDAVDAILDPQRTDANRGMSEGALVVALYPETQNFVDEVVNRMIEQGFTPAQIAYGLEGLPELLDIFSPYIVENTGDIGPAPIRRNNADIGDVALAIHEIPGPAAAAAAAAPALGVVPGPRARPVGRHVPTPERNAPRQAWDYPPTREALRNQLDTIAKITAFGAKIPRQYGGPYKPRAGSYVKTGITHIIKLIKEHMDPNY